MLGHLIEAKPRGFAGRIRILLDVLLDELVRPRAESVTLVATRRPDDLIRSGRHPKVGTLRVADLLHEWIHHDRNHLRQLLANVQSYVWPHMGNAQRFSIG